MNSLLNFNRAYATFKEVTGAPDLYNPSAAANIRNELQLKDTRMGRVVYTLNSAAWQMQTDIMLFRTFRNVSSPIAAWRLTQVAKRTSGTACYDGIHTKSKERWNFEMTQAEMVAELERGTVPTYMDGKRITKWFEKKSKDPNKELQVSSSCRVNETSDVCVGYIGNTNKASIDYSDTFATQLMDPQCKRIVGRISMVGSAEAHEIFFTLDKVRLEKDIITLVDSNGPEIHYVYAELAAATLRSIVTEETKGRRSVTVQEPQGITCQKKASGFMKGSCYIWALIGTELAIALPPNSYEHQNVLQHLDAKLVKNDGISEGRGTPRGFTGNDVLRAYTTHVLNTITESLGFIYDWRTCRIQSSGISFDLFFDGEKGSIFVPIPEGENLIVAVPELKGKKQHDANLYFKEHEDPEYDEAGQGNDAMTIRTSEDLGLDGYAFDARPDTILTVALTYCSWLVAFARCRAAGPPVPPQNLHEIHSLYERHRPRNIRQIHVFRSYYAKLRESAPKKNASVPPPPPKKSNKRAGGYFNSFIENFKTWVVSTTEDAENADYDEDISAFSDNESYMSNSSDLPS